MTKFRTPRWTFRVIVNWSGWWVFFLLWNSSSLLNMALTSYFPLNSFHYCPLLVLPGGEINSKLRRIIKTFVTMLWGQKLCQNWASLACNQRIQSVVSWKLTDTFFAINQPLVMFVVLVSLVTVMSATRVTFSAKSLQLKNHSLGEVQGCYIHNHTLSVCFQIRKGFMKLLKMNGDEILHYRQLTPKMILYQVLDQAFVW